MKKYILLIGLICFSICIHPIESFNFKSLDVKDGIPDNYIYAILQDSYGFMWFISGNGLSRYDGYNFKYYSIAAQGSDVYNIKEDKNKNIWIQAGEKYFVYNRVKDCIDDNITDILQGAGIQSKIELLFVDYDNNIWFSTGDKLIYYEIDKNKFSNFILSANDRIKWIECRNKQAYILFTNGQVRKVNFKTKQISDEVFLSLSTYPHHRMYLDYAFNLWFYTPHSSEDALRYYNPRTKELKKFTDHNNRAYYFVTAVVDDSKGNIWIGTDNTGITIYNTNSSECTEIEYEKSNEFSIPTNHINCFYYDKQNIMWVGTSKRGVAYTCLSNTLFKRRNISEQDDISCVLEDHDGNIWLGSDGDGITHINTTTNRLTKYNHRDGSISENLIVCSFLDSKNRIWFGTYGGGVFYYEKGKFTSLHYNDVNRKEDPLQDIRSINEDMAGNIWIGTVVKGLYCYETNGTFTNYTVDDIPIASNSITDLYCQYGQNLYIATSAGLYVMDTYSRQVSQLSKNSAHKQMFDSFISCVYRDSRGLLWIGGKEGLWIYNETQDSIASLNSNNGLSHNFVRGITEDHNKNIWITTDVGVTNIVVVNDPMSLMPTFRCYRYYDEDGLGNIMFNNHSIWCKKNGEIMMGGIGGYIKTMPEPVPYNPYKSKVEFTALYIANKRIEVDEIINGRVLLNKNIQLLKEISLDYSNNNFTIDVSSLNYQALHKTLFAYRLEDHTEWIQLNGNTISFNKLHPGTYNLQVKVIGDEYQNNEISSLTIHINPPFWLSSTAYILYVIFICAIVVASIMYIRRKAKFKLKMQNLELDVAKQHEIDEAQMRFFTNVSHDLRTPLSLIITPLEKLLASSISDNQVKSDLKLMHRNAEILMGEVNQLLDLRKLENGKSELKLSHGNISEFIKETCGSFEPYSNKKGIQLKLILKSPSIEMDFDRNKIQRILMNLLSNAYKFNTENGSITITVDKITEANAEKIRIQVADTGIGISEDGKELIFERFYQETHTSDYIGSGIGLHIVKEYVSMHGGNIEVKNNVPRGTVFVITLPISLTYEKYAEEEQVEEIVPTEDMESTENDYPILIVEDNDDFRQFLIDCLKEHYPVVAAPNGKKALSVMSHQPVKMVISDVMMPVMDGLELCNKIKGDIRFSHIPVILLTARAADEHVLSGLKEGADDYITKPFNLDILLLRINKLLEWRKMNYNKFKTIDIEPSEITISSLDEQLISKAIKLVEENISNPEFSVEELSSAIGMTRGHLYKKLMTITGKSPIEFIRAIRIKRGKQLLEKSQLGVSEIAYEVGLSPKQFSKYFKEAYGELPSEYKKKEDR